MHFKHKGYLFSKTSIGNHQTLQVSQFFIYYVFTFQDKMNTLCFTKSSLLTIKSRYLPFIKGFSFHIRNAKIKPPPFSRCIVFSIRRSRGILATKLSLNTFLKAWNNSIKMMRCLCLLWHLYLRPVVIGLHNRGPKNCSVVYLVP